MTDCRCYIEHGDGDIEEIIQCPLCAAAPDLLGVIKQIKVLNAGKDNDISWLCDKAIERTRIKCN
jgi:hypothetical protein